jgi:hypothetical protein
VAQVPHVPSRWRPLWYHGCRRRAPAAVPGSVTRRRLSPAGAQSPGRSDAHSSGRATSCARRACHFSWRRLAGRLILILPPQRGCEGACGAGFTAPPAHGVTPPRAVAGGEEGLAEGLAGGEEGLVRERRAEWLPWVLLGSRRGQPTQQHTTEHTAHSTQQQRAAVCSVWIDTSTHGIEYLRVRCRRHFCKARDREISCHNPVQSFENPGSSDVRSYYRRAKFFSRCDVRSYS